MAKKKPTDPKKIIYALIVLVVFGLTAGQVDLSQVDLTDPSSIISAFQSSQARLIDYSRLQDLPEYDGKNDVVTLNDDKPEFTEADLSLTDGNWQKFTPLDRLNRVGVANAMLHKSMMPTEKRTDIADVKPSGWKQMQLTEGTYLYNRSHLIAYRFTGENDNWLNLMTGTEQFNQDNMTLYEDKVADYLKKTNHHVRFRVTPYFKGNELVARGVEIEAQSIEDDELSFHVFLYNVQEGVTIDYLTGKAQMTK